MVLLFVYFIFVIIFIIIGIICENHFLYYSNIDLEKSNDVYFFYQKNFPQTNKDWEILIFNISKKKLPYVPQDHIVTGIICYGIDDFVMDIIRSRHSYFFRSMIYFSTNTYYVKYNLLKIMKKLYFKKILKTERGSLNEQ